MDADKERNHLRNMVEILLLNAFKDKCYFKNDAIRHLLREVLVNKGIDLSYIKYFHHHLAI
jgi:hypothetical protein